MVGQVIKQMGSIYSGLSTGKKVGLISIGTLVVVGLALMVHLANRPDYRLLFSNLSPQDAAVIIDKLKEQRLPFKVAGNGERIMIPAEKVDEMRLQMASQGIPQGDEVGFEIFDQSSPWSTDFVQRLNYQRALQGELARTISSLEEVEGARVHIVMPKESLFVEEQKKATASVVLKMRSGRSLSKSQLRGIVHLVAGSVEGLAPENVTVVDNNGTILAGPKGDAFDGELATSQADTKRRMELELQERLQAMVDKALGKNKSVVNVSMTVNFRRVERTEEKYDTDNVVMKSEQRSSEKSTGPASLLQGESELLKEEGVVPAGSNQQKRNEMVNYEVGRVVNRIVEPVGKVERLYVAVLIDGSYESVEGEAKPRYIPRPAEEIKVYESLIKRAAGFDEERGDQLEIANVRFDSAGSLQETEKVESVSVMERVKVFSFIGQRYLVKIALFLLFFLFMVRPLYKWFLSQERRVISSQENSRTLAPHGEDVRIAWHERKELPPRERALDIVRADPVRAAEIARKWLKEGE